MRRGEVVSVNWPFSDYGGAKVRPAVVVRADFLDGLTDVALVKITRRAFGIPGTEVELDPVPLGTDEGLLRLLVRAAHPLGHLTPWKPRRYPLPK